MKYTGIIVLVCLSLIVQSQPAGRYKATINEAWKFRKGDISINYPAFTDPAMLSVALPHTWNSEDVFDDVQGFYQGIGWYIKNLYTDSSFTKRKTYLYFEAVFQDAEVYVNGNLAGKHKGGYTGFYIDITPHLLIGPGRIKNEIAVKADNRKNDDIPPLSGDFNMYGGIYRDVYLITVPQIHFSMNDYGSQGVFIETPDVSREKATVRISGSLINEGRAPQSCKIVSVISDAQGNTVAEVTGSYKCDTSVTTEFVQNSKPISYPRLWSPADPYLYSVSTRLFDEKSGILLDEVVHPLGFRYFRFDAARGFYLNDQPIKLIGVNRHQDYPGLGNALPNDLHRQDVRLIKEMGANFLRTSHYPQDHALIEECDRQGIIVSIEIPVVNTITESSGFTANCQQQLLEMIHQYRNHPSIFIWCLGNEIMLKPPYPLNDLKALTPQEVKYINSISTLYKGLNDIVKKEDKSRPTMIVFHGAPELYEKAMLTTIADINGWNLYAGWYRLTLNDLSEMVNKCRNTAPGKPIILTEYGAGADINIRSLTPERFDFSIDYQNMFHSHYLKVIRETPFIAGSSLWCFADFGSEGREDTYPHINNKGIMTFDRKPKDTYCFYKAILTNEPYLKIAPVQVEKITGLQDDTTVSTLNRPIWIYSNLEKVELIVNRKSIDRISPVNGVALFTAPLSDGENTIEALGVREGKLYKEMKKLNVKIIPQRLTNTDFPFTELNINCGSYIEYTDKSGNQWMPDKPYSKGSYGYIGGSNYRRWMKSVPGSNFDYSCTKDEPIFQTCRDSADSYRFDVPAGRYEITIYLGEVMTEKEMKSVYNLGAEQGNESVVRRIFDLSINGTKIWAGINLLADYGEERAVIKTFEQSVTGNGGLEIKFTAIQSSPLINGIRIRKL